ncbi:MAG TPA: nitroreductase/quinone reductase family protein [Streptosporangiaceae bacterium]
MRQDRPVVEASYPPDIVTRLFNPMARFALSTPLGGPLRRRYMLLHFTGRKSGRRYVVPVTVHRADDRLYVLTGARWRVNFRGGADVEVTVDGRTTPMRGELVERPETVAPIYARRIEEYGLRVARIELAVKINVPRVPTVPELIEAVRREGLSVIWLLPKP